MLTKADFDQLGKVVRKIVREEVEAEIKDSTQTVRSDVRESRMRLQSDINDLDDRIKNVEVRMDGSDKNISLVIENLDKVEQRLGNVEADVKDIKTELIETQKSFKKLLPELQSKKKGNIP